MTCVSAASLPGLLTVPPIPPLQTAADRPPGGRMLVIEGETVIALDLQRIVREAGYRIVGPASSLREAKALMARGRIDCALVDFDAPPYVGLEAADMLAEAGIPFVLLASGRAQVPAKHAARPFVEKPYSETSLLEAIEQATGSSSRRRVGAVAPPPFPRILPQL